MTGTVRPYRPADLPALYDICLRTADGGADATASYAELDRDLVGAIFAAPYAVLEPDLAFVVDEGDGQPVGYILGAADTAAFVKRFRAEWLPTVAGRWPAPPDGSAAEPATATELMTLLLHTPERMVLPDLATYPAHLHLDLLPRAQRSGHGRALMTAYLAALAAKGVPAVHLGMLTTNTPARAFYDRLGFHEIPVADPGPLTYLGRSTA
ncbi:Acetyltransferase (GNAT) family protein [Actinacidiphila yanglinensis]|uniref:Acetyltransferase (GNAT) family protein n=1 Tax=Actinacidiphila yanglinensis TaxID=310779 RepID=A0A1H5Y282_9ACTN|nr:GNAT family N-acetyltransferase [Actinacidiphila yanglinensis]SEG18033.1 Acetyltransferase (GNAT) family protein [Actinacidiphila yanglinensis]